MALVFTLYPRQSFYVADEEVVVERVVSGSHFVLRHKDVLYDVVGDKTAEIMPNVMISAGTEPWDRPGAVRAAIQAPREIVILRKNLKDRARCTPSTRT